jgi:hypothetical protein
MVTYLDANENSEPMPYLNCAEYSK